MRSPFVGQPVRLKRRVSDDQRPTVIAMLYSDIDGGVRLADERGGFVPWNAADLTPVRLSDVRAYRAAGGDTTARPTRGGRR